MRGVREETHAQERCDIDYETTAVIGRDPGPAVSESTNRHFPSKAFRVEELEALVKARELFADIFRVTDGERFRREHAIRNQMRGAAFSIGSNIAEGFERPGGRQFRNFLVIAKGSAGEIRVQCHMVHDVGLISDTHHDELVDLCLQVSKLLAGLIRKLDAAPDGAASVAPGSWRPSIREDYLDYDLAFESQVLEADS